MLFEDAGERHAAKQMRGLICAGFGPQRAVTEQVGISGAWGRVCSGYSQRFLGGERNEP